VSTLLPSEDVEQVNGGNHSDGGVVVINHENPAIGGKKKEKKEKKKTKKAMSFTRDLKNKEAASKPVHVSGREFADEGGHGVDSPHRDSRVFFLVETT